MVWVVRDVLLGGEWQIMGNKKPRWPVKGLGYCNVLCGLSVRFIPQLALSQRNHRSSMWLVRAMLSVCCKIIIADLLVWQKTPERQLVYVLAYDC